LAVAVDVPVDELISEIKVEQVVTEIVN